MGGQRPRLWSRLHVGRAPRRPLNDPAAAAAAARLAGSSSSVPLPGHDNIPMATDGRTDGDARRAPNTKQSIVNVGDRLPSLSRSLGSPVPCRRRRRCQSDRTTLQPSLHAAPPTPRPASVSFVRLSQSRWLAFPP